MPNQKQKSKRNMSTGQSTLEDYKMSGDPKYRGLFPSVPKYFDSESKSWLVWKARKLKEAANP